MSRKGRETLASRETDFLWRYIFSSRDCYNNQREHATSIIEGGLAPYLSRAIGNISFLISYIAADDMLTRPTLSSKIEWRHPLQRPSYYTLTFLSRKLTAHVWSLRVLGYLSSNFYG